VCCYHHLLMCCTAYHKTTCMRCRSLGIAYVHTAAPAACVQARRQLEQWLHTSSTNFASTQSQKVPAHPRNLLLHLVQL
jgi:hypothetical protein